MMQGPMPPGQMQRQPMMRGSKGPRGPAPVAAKRARKPSSRARSSALKRRAGMPAGRPMLPGMQRGPMMEG